MFFTVLETTPTHTELKKTLIDDIRRIMTTSRYTAIRSVESARVETYWQIGRVIFEEEQERKERAGYSDFSNKITV